MDQVQGQALAGNRTRGRLNPDWSRRIEHTPGEQAWFSVHHYTDHLVYKHFEVEGKRVLLKSDDGFWRNLWIASPDGNFYDRGSTYDEFPDSEETVPEEKSQSLDSNESDDQTPNQEEQKESDTGVESFNDLLAERGELVEGNSTANRKKKARQKPVRSMKEAIYSRKEPKDRKSNSPNMKPPFQEVPKPTPTLTRIIPVGDDRWELIAEGELLLQQHHKEAVDQFDKEQAREICSPYQVEPGISDFARDAYEALGDENLASDDYYDGQDHIFTTDFGTTEEPFVQPNPRRTVRSPPESIPQRTLSYDKECQSAQNSPNQNQYNVLQDDQGEDEGDETINAPIPQGEGNELDAEGYEEPQEDLEGGSRHNSDDDVKDSDFREASSE